MTDTVETAELELDTDAGCPAELALLAALRDHPEVLTSFGPKAQVNAKEPRSFVTFEGPEELILSIYEYL